MFDRPSPLNEEIKFGVDEIIVSKTDTRGYLTYANDVFCRVAEMSTHDVIGKPHAIIRHPDMPRAVFKLLWETIKGGNEIFAYVKNMSATGRYYWVIAHVTPSFAPDGSISGFHSNRRCPSRKGISDIEPLYQRLLDEERKHSNPKDGLAASYQYLTDMLAEKQVSYSKFIWSTGE
ncbi:PAS domain-containing protein [Gimibacter soli]|uniref:PAS domain-containing protein n=1 Tax=Gimibacter soli TaxID=3024400 RepID=A0AAE9XRF4_9PROT|nr:PAS domain-containing protein [Gimibacter soli]WCL54739.1 PAS domain-containing protein [Gimibacter soli]